MNFKSEMRKIRIDLCVPASAMSAALGCSATFQYMIESGLKRIPEGYLDRLLNVYPELESRRLHIATIINMQRGYVQFEVTDYLEAQLITSMALSWPSLTANQKQQISTIVNTQKST